MSVEREVRWLIDGVLGDDVAMSLACLRILQDDYLPWLERSAVLRARRSGRDWARIGRLLGRSRQAVRKRFGGVAPVGALLPPSLPATEQSEVEAERRAVVAQFRRERDADDAATTGSLTAW
jgi:hypothetical protein